MSEKGSRSSQQGQPAARPPALEVCTGGLCHPLTFWQARVAKEEAATHRA